MIYQEVLPNMTYTYTVEQENDLDARMLGYDVVVTRSDGVEFLASRTWVMQRVTDGVWEFVA